MLINQFYECLYVCCDDASRMNNESICHQQQPSTLTVDTLSYKELQSLAMSLSLPGKMKVLIHFREITHLTYLIIFPARCFSGSHQSSTKQQRRSCRFDFGSQSPKEDPPPGTKFANTAATTIKTQKW